MFEIMTQNQIMQEQLDKLLAKGKLGLKLTKTTAQLHCIDNVINLELAEQAMAVSSIPYTYKCQLKDGEIKNNGELVLDNIRRMLTGGKVSYYSAYMIEEQPAELANPVIKNETCPADVFEELMKVNNFVVTFARDQQTGDVKINHIMIPAMQIQRNIKAENDEEKIPIRAYGAIKVLDQTVNLETTLINVMTFNPGAEYSCIYRVLVQSTNAAP